MTRHHSKTITARATAAVVAAVFALTVCTTVHAVEWQVNLQRVPIPSKIAGAPPVEYVYVTNVTWGYGQDYKQVVQTAFDITSAQSWIIDETCRGCQSGGVGVYVCQAPCEKLGEYCPNTVNYVYGAQVQFVTATATSDATCQKGTDTILVGDTEFAGVSVSFPSAVSLLSYQDLLNVAPAGLGLAGRVRGPASAYQQPFMQFVDAQLALKRRVVSFYMWDNQEVLTAVFGAPDGFYKADEQWKVFQSPRAKTFGEASAYYLRMEHVRVEASAAQQARLAQHAQSARLSAVVSVPGQKKLNAVFVTTSAYIYVQDSQWLSLQLVPAIAASAQAVCTFRTDLNQYHCNTRSVDAFPDLHFSFQTAGKGSPIEHIVVRARDYVEAVPGNEVRLLIVPGQYAASDAELGYGALPDVWLGAPVFKSNYIAFDYDTRDVYVARKYSWAPQAITIGESSLVQIVTVGALLLFISVVTVLRLLKDPPLHKQQRALTGGANSNLRVSTVQRTSRSETQDKNNLTHVRMRSEADRPSTPLRTSQSNRGAVVAPKNMFSIAPAQYVAPSSHRLQLLPDNSVPYGSIAVPSIPGTRSIVQGSFILGSAFPPAASFRGRSSPGSMHNQNRPSPERINQG